MKKNLYDESRGDSLHVTDSKAINRQQSVTTEIVFILDRSGSMEGLEADTIGGFNSMMKKQKEEPGEAFVSTVLFDDVCEVIHDRVPLDEVKKLTEKEYFVRGCTALLDAVGGAIHHIGNIHKYAREEDRPEKTLFIITTDGMENASRRYSAADVKKLVEAQKETGWEFLFLGANIDAIETAEQFGIDASRAVNYHSDRIGTRKAFDAFGGLMCCFAAAPVGSARAFDESLLDDLRKDFIDRKADK